MRYFCFSLLVKHPPLPKCVVMYVVCAVWHFKIINVKRYERTRTKCIYVAVQPNAQSVSLICGHTSWINHLFTIFRSNIFWRIHTITSHSSLVLPRRARACAHIHTHMNPSAILPNERADKWLNGYAPSTSKRREGQSKRASQQKVQLLNIHFSSIPLLGEHRTHL